EHAEDRIKELKSDFAAGRTPQFVAGSDSIEVDSATVGEALRQLVAAHPQVERNLFNEQGKLRSFVNVYVDDEDIRYLDREDTALEAGSTVSIVPSIAGGTTRPRR
ncbi:MAG: MoaD/ThiS family protein, partial [Bryobacterales bacterium]|nr:MoaD/ThiS family protein [Bryobacterales bacterium]